MRRRDINLLLLIVLVTALAIWINLSETWLGRDVHTRFGLDLRGGTEVLLRASAPNVTAEQLDIARNTIEQRVNGLGVAEATVQTSGSNRIIVQLPDVAEPEQALETIRSTGKLEFVNPGEANIGEGALVRTTGSPTLPSTASPTETTTAESIPVLEVIADGTDLDLATVQPGVGQTGEPFVAFTFTGDSARTLEQFTAANVGKLMAIVLDNEVHSVATIRDVLPGSGQISTNTTADRDAILNVLKYGSLPVRFEVETSRSVTASLGQGSINSSFLAGLVGLSAVALFMIVYYRLPGLLAVVALVIYTLITFALYRVIPITLTLAGIAGFILSVGLAVDANVLIFARLKEELRRGRPLAVAVEQGFEHAWPSIRDSSVATLITSTILYWFGSNFGVSIIKGFALTLALGMIVSLFTSVVITRTFLRLVVRSGRFTNPWLYAAEAPRGPATGATEPLMEA